MVVSSVLIHSTAQRREFAFADRFRYAVLACFASKQTCSLLALLIMSCNQGQDTLLSAIAGHQENFGERLSAIETNLDGLLQLVQGLYSLQLGLQNGPLQAPELQM